MNIAQKESVSQLTFRGVYSLLDEGKKDVIVQVLEPEAIVNQKSDNKSLKFKVFISDGHTKHKAVLGNEASQAFDGAGQPGNCIIRVLELMQQNAQPQKRLVIITKIEIINTDVDEFIGQPMEYQEWLSNNKQNKSGSNQIPQRFLSNFRSQNQTNNYAANNNNNNNNSMNSTPYQNNNRQQQQQPQPVANQQSYNNNNQRVSNPPPSNQAPSRNSNVGGNNFNNNNNNNNNYNNMNNMNNMNNNNNNNFNNNNQRNMNPSNNNNNNNNNRFGNQNENIPPAGNNNFKGQQDQKKGPVSYVNHNQNQFNVPENEFLPLNTLAPYSPFVIKVRITNKSNLRSFTKQNTTQTSHVFSVDLIDKEGNEISATFFGEAAEHFHPNLEENSVYIMRGSNVKMTGGKFNKKPGQDYQIVFDNVAAQIQKVEGDNDIMVNKFNFTKLSNVDQLENNENLDVAAYIKEARPVTSVLINKTGENKSRRVITLYDDSNALIEMTLWGDIADQDLHEDTLILVKNARVSVFNNNKGLSSSFTTKIIDRQDLIPDGPEIRRLREWKQNEFRDDQLDNRVREAGPGRKFIPFTIDEINSFTDIKDAAFFDLTAFIGHVKTETQNLYYAACPNTKCNRKVQDDGIAKCEFCNHNYGQPAYRYTLSMKLSDHTGSLWVSVFDQVAKAIVVQDAKQIKDLKEQGDETRIQEIFRDAHHKEFKFKLLAKPDNYQGNSRIKIQAIRAVPINYTNDSKDLLNLLETYSQKDSIQSE